MAFLKVVNAALFGGNVRPGLLERFAMSNDVITRVATPIEYAPNSTTRTYYFPSESFNVVPSPTPNAVIFKITLIEDRALLFTSLFPEGTLSDDGTFETSKDFTAENAGGETVVVSDYIESVEISSPVFSIPLELKILSQNSTTANGTRTETISYDGLFPSSIIPNFDPSTPLVNQQLLYGTFNGIVSAETSTYKIKYNKELITPATWEDGSDSVNYSPYCVLTPENIEFKRSMHVYFNFSSNLETFRVNIINYYNAKNYAPFYHVKY